MNLVPLGSVCEIIMGQAPEGSSYNHSQEGVPLLGGAGDFGEDHPRCKKHTSSPTKLSRDGDLLLCIRATIGDINWSDGVYCLGRGVAALRPKNGAVDINYVANYLRANVSELNNLGRGSTFKQISRDDISEFTIPLPPVEEQKRIAAMLDKADAIRRKRDQAIQLGDDFLRSLFLDMFGDPVRNPKGWPVRRLGTAALRFSDGPFGSNLKTEHYVDSGIRVVRLQNIGAGTFRDGDKAFISEQHAETISRHLCQVGDLLIATLGSPNLRACILPETVGSAINKADCLRLKPDPRIANAPYLCWLLNSPQVLVACSDAIHGQTRSRISFGYLRDLEIITPPIQLQNEFAARVEFVREVRSLENRGLELSQEIAKSVNATAFGATSIDRNRSKV